MRGSASGAAHAPAVQVVNHDVPTDPVALAAKRIEQADAAVASATAKVERQKEHLASAALKRKGTLQAHLKGAQQALAQAIAQRKELG